MILKIFLYKGDSFYFFRNFSLYKGKDFRNVQEFALCLKISFWIEDENFSNKKKKLSIFFGCYSCWFGKLSFLKWITFYLFRKYFSYTKNIFRNLQEFIMCLKISFWIEQDKFPNRKEKLFFFSGWYSVLVRKSFLTNKDIYNSIFYKKLFRILFLKCM